MSTSPTTSSTKATTGENPWMLGLWSLAIIGIIAGVLAASAGSSPLVAVIGGALLSGGVFALVAVLALSAFQWERQRAQ
jgi:hypothetical protein